VSPQEIKLHHSVSATGGGIKTVRQLEQVFEPYRKVFRDMKGGGGLLSVIGFSRVVLEPNSREKRGIAETVYEEISDVT
jgi:hypothetical protein